MIKYLLAAALIACATLAAIASVSPSALPRVELKRVPEGGIQPQTAVGPDGTVHLVYYQGDPSAGDLFYCRAKGGGAFSHGIRVNSVPGSAVAIGNIRGARIAAGRRGRVFIAWNGSRKMADPAGGDTPMLFSRLNDAGNAFEPERNLIHTAFGIDGGGGLAADTQGRVYVFWHAPLPGQRGEGSRTVWMTRSDDDGKTFEPERTVWNWDTGACGCCSLTAYAARRGALYVLFRSAQETVHRDMYLLESDNHGTSFQGADISKWKVGYCVMSSEAFASGPQRAVAAWETEKKIHFGLIPPDPSRMTDSILPGSGANQKYPALAINRTGLILLAWTEGMAWKRGGSLRWQTLDRSGRPMGAVGRADGVPAWSLVSAYSAGDGHFVILY